MRKRPQDFLAPFLGYGLITLLVLAILAGIAIFGGTVMTLLGLQYESVGSILLFFGITALAGFPLELMASALPKALLSLGKITPKAAKLLGFLLDTGATALVMAAVDSWMPSIEATPVSILAVSLLLALPSVEKNRRKEGQAGRTRQQDNETGEKL